MTDLPQLRIYSEDEIDVLLDGDRRQVDRLILTGINGIIDVLMSHVDSETPRLEELGTVEQIRQRSEWIDATIAREKAKAAMMRRVSESAITWALIAFLGFMLVSMAHSAIDFMREHIKAGTHP